MSCISLSKKRFLHWNLRYMITIFSLPIQLHEQSIYRNRWTQIVIRNKVQLQNMKYCASISLHNKRHSCWLSCLPIYLRSLSPFSCRRLISDCVSMAAVPPQRRQLRPSASGHYYGVCCQPCGCQQLEHTDHWSNHHNRVRAHTGHCCTSTTQWRSQVTAAAAQHSEAHRSLLHQHNTVRLTGHCCISTTQWGSQVTAASAQHSEAHRSLLHQHNTIRLTGHCCTSTT